MMRPIGKRLAGPCGVCGSRTSVFCAGSPVIDDPDRCCGTSYRTGVADFYEAFAYSLTALEIAIAGDRATIVILVARQPSARNPNASSLSFCCCHHRRDLVRGDIESEAISGRTVCRFVHVACVLQTVLTPSGRIRTAEVRALRMSALNQPSISTGGTALDPRAT